MLVLHTHWSPPRSPNDTGQVILWAETSNIELPVWRRGRLPKRPVATEHPFCLAGSKLQTLLELPAKAGKVVLRLPTARSGPLPSPKLAHSWLLDRDNDPILAPWIVSGISLNPAKAFQILLNLNEGQEKNFKTKFPWLLSDEAKFWQRAAALVQEILAAQKIMPVLVPLGPPQSFQARWLPVLDSTKDAQRLRKLESSMPPVCRAEISEANSQETSIPPGALLKTFINTFCDSLAREWGRMSMPDINRLNERVPKRWIAALFSKDPTVKGTSAQLQAFSASYKAWIRHLSTAGDAAFRIAFRLEAPPPEITGKAQPNWKLRFLLQASDDPSLMVQAETIWESRGNTLNLLNRRFEQPQEKLLTGLGYAARLFPPMTNSLKTKSPSSVALDSQQAYNFLREAAPLLESAGFGVLVPPWWNKAGSRLGVRLKLRSSGAGSSAVSQGKLSLENLVNFNWELTLGETVLSEQEFRALASLKSPLLQVRGQWVQLDPEQIEAAIKFWENKQMTGEMSLLEAAQYGLGSPPGEGSLPIDEIIAEGWLTEWLERLENPDHLEVLPQPAGLEGRLRPYQRYGYSWMHFHRRWGFGACLADDMGLGKTIQTLALLLKEKENNGSLPGPTLLICPTSVVKNWEHEINRFAPSLNIHMHQGARRLRDKEFIETAQAADMVLTSYPLARQDAGMFQNIAWFGIVLDEAQNIKNPAARQTQVIRKFNADFRLALTGTPVENRLSELWSIMNFLNPGYLGTQQKFRSDFALPIERYNDKDVVKRLKQLVGPFILRRVKTDPRVIQDLPEKVETKVYCNLTEEQATLYEAVVQEVMKQIEEKEGIQRRGLVLSMLLQLKQICNHPNQYLHEKRGAFTGRSGKLERLEALLEEILAADERALIFTQFAEMGKLLEGNLPTSTRAAVQFLHGGTPTKSRDEMVKRFQEDQNGPPIFILSIKAGGTGLNLTRANHVFHFDRWWNPAVEDQATDRAFRIGQKRNVQVHKFVCTGTVEEKIDEMIENKKGLAQSVVGSGENWLTELSTQELRQIVTLRR